MLGYNYYYNNQWVTGTNEILEWKIVPADHRFVPLHQLLLATYERYNRPIVLTETSHPKEDRPIWIEMLAEECALTLKCGVPLWGVCWYPLIDRPDWDHLDNWHQSGLWDGEFNPDQLQRLLHVPSAKALLKAQNLLQPYLK